ncbi:MAG TPA: ATP-binding protein [Flavobacteriales bacterium]
MTFDQLALPVIVATILLLLTFGFVGALLVVNNTRRIRHRAELAEADLRREREVLSAEREATQQTLREVGRELHDNVGQLLTVAQMGLNTVMETTVTDARLETVRDALDNGIEEVRRLGHSLNSDLWEQRSFVDAISAEAERIERVGRITAHVLVKGEVPALPPDASTILFRIFQETVTNALKHSGADRLDITLSGDPTFTLTIADNGRGFDGERTTAHGGLVNIPKRCALIGFDAHCVSTPDHGCTWTFTQRSGHGA